jgi:predicted  nucleic acid-binding Zn-ribbon protein
LIVALATTGVAIVLNGCASSSGYKGADKTGAGIAGFRDEIVNGKQAIDATMKSLGEIAASASTDPRKAFEQYKKDLAALDSTAAKIRKRAQGMQEQGQAYFAQWQKELSQVNNPDIRKLAEQRKAKLQEAFDQISKTTQPLKEKFDPWMTDLKDIQTYLGNDLTVAGVDAAKKSFKKAFSEGIEIQKAMDELVAELNTIAAAITPEKVVPQPTEGQKK